MVSGYADREKNTMIRTMGTVLNNCISRCFLFVAPKVRCLLSTQRGFMIVELLVVVALLGVLASIIVPNVGSFIRKGNEEAWQTEFINIQTAVTALLTASTTSQLDSTSSAVAVDPANATATNDMDDVYTTDSPPLVLNDYLTGLKDDGTIQSDCTYRFGTKGQILQTTP